MRLRVAALAGMAAMRAAPAFAQEAPLSATLEIASQERRRGLGWSDGDPVARATLSVPVATGLSLEASAVTLWGSNRLRGADAVADLGALYSVQSGGWRLFAEARYHLFPGAAHMAYGEAGAGVGYLLGPASLDLSATYAPRQSAIGGDNLHLNLAASMAIPGTPLTASAHVGRSSGTVSDSLNAARLRPDGTYWNHGAGVDWLHGRWSAGLRYSNSSIDRAADRHAGAALVARVGVSL
jgi:hypothetical protein